MGCGASKHAGVEEAPVYKATADVHPRDGVMLVKGKALLTLAEHEEYGKMTSHQILVVLTKKFKQGKGEKSQKQIMVELGMFQDADFEIATFDALERNQSRTVLTYTWNDSPVREQYGPLNKKMEAQGIDMSAQWFWIDIFCLDQQHPDKMETIKRSNEIYALAKYYFVIGLACFNRLWCTMELACKLGGQNGANTDVVVTDFEGFLRRREEAYVHSHFSKDPTFEACRYTSATDVPIVKEKILAKFEDIAAFNDTIKNIADVILEEDREDDWYFGVADVGSHDEPSSHKAAFIEASREYTFKASGGDENKCGRCDKLKEHHHTKKRDGTISKHVWCYDFLLDV